MTVTATVTAPHSPDVVRGGHAWDLHHAVSVREEDFGALLYHFGTRRLSFVTSPRLLAVVRALADARSAADACDASFRAEPGSPGERAAVATGLDALARGGMLVEREASS